MTRDSVQHKPGVWLVGDAEHADFAEAMALVRATANVGPGLPEVIVLAQSRPGVLRLREIERLQRSAPLAAVVSLAGSWCEGETRTGRPAAGVRRVYWYEFPSWWRQQLRLRAAGLCPEWVRAEDFGSRAADCAISIARVAIETDSWEAAAAITDILRSVGTQSIWSRPARMAGEIGAVSAGIWEGGQLSNVEIGRLAAYCERLAAYNAPVVALLDFPRRDRCEVARQAGAAAVLGKPWRSAELVETLQQVVDVRARMTRAA